MITFSSAGLSCKLSLVLQSSMDSSLLLKDYFQLDSRVRLLGVALRWWARQVKVESGEEGGGGPVLESAEAWRQRLQAPSSFAGSKTSLA